MLKLIKKVLKTGEATAAYPAAPLERVANFRGKPEYHAQQCIACGACANACPSNALTMTPGAAGDSLRWSLFLGRCIFCARCEEVCPTAAITLSPAFELSVWKKEDLFESADFPLCDCRQCGKPYAVQKEIDFALSLLQESAALSDRQLAARRVQYETCPECKKMHSLIASDRIDIARHPITETR